MKQSIAKNGSGLGEKNIYQSFYRAKLWQKIQIPGNLVNVIKKEEKILPVAKLYIYLLGGWIDLPSDISVKQLLINKDYLFNYYYFNQVIN